MMVWLAMRGALQEAAPQGIRGVARFYVAPMRTGSGVLALDPA
jgi:hypothetical protein